MAELVKASVHGVTIARSNPGTSNLVERADTFASVVDVSRYVYNEQMDLHHAN